MNHGIVRVSKTGSDEVLAEYPFSPALVTLAKVRLTNAGNTALIDSTDSDDTEAFGLYVGYLAAKLARVAGLPNIKPEDVSKEKMLEYSLEWESELKLPEQEKPKPKAGEGEDENPTEPSGESSSD